MSKYIIVSELVGTPGDEFIPDEGINVEALLDGGFIKSDNKATKSAKTEPTEENPNGN
jgi:hypothetical protein